MAHLSRPARVIKRRYKEENRKPQGRKKLRSGKAVVYHTNWTSPFLWRQIEAACRRSGGPTWSTTGIVKDLQSRDPNTFNGLARQTMDGWIDRSGSKPRWHQSHLDRIQKGDNVSNPNAGRKGILVRKILRQCGLV